MGGNSSSKEPITLGETWEDLEFEKSNLEIKFYENCNIKSSGRMISVFRCLDSQRSDAVEEFLKYFQLYRHPSLLSYLNSWRDGNYLFIITSPIRRLRPSQDLLCHEVVGVGMQVILEGMEFLHEKVQKIPAMFEVSNVFVSTDDNSWKLLAYPLCNASDIKTAEKCLLASLSDFIGGLKIEFTGCEGLVSYLKKQQHFVAKSILAQEFFCFDFMRIWTFLRSLPVRSSLEKEEFFRDASEKLLNYPERLVGQLIVSMLLQRICLMDSHAHNYLYPLLLVPRRNNPSMIDCHRQMFSTSNFKVYVVPHVLTIFRVRDAGVRMALLTYFEDYVDMIDSADLERVVLPELLLGVRDTSEMLVTRSLRCLATLVPILGSLAVVGHNRQKLFGDGRPKETSSKISDLPNIVPEVSFDNPIVKDDKDIPPRSSPDGREIDPEWSSWSDPLDGEPGDNLDTSDLQSEHHKLDIPESKPNSAVNSIAEDKEVGSEFQIQITQKEEEVNFFADMEPKLDLKKQSLEDVLSLKTTDDTEQKFAMVTTQDVTGDAGWDDLECS